MFYTIVSKTPLVPSNDFGTKFFRVFLLGSIAYILLNYFVYSSDKGFVFDKVKDYFYYLVALDLVIAYIICRWLSNYIDEDEIVDDNQTVDREQYKQQKQDIDNIDNNVQELRRMMEHKNMMRQRMMTANPQVQQELDNRNDNQNGTASQQSPFMTKEEAAEEENIQSSNKNVTKKNEKNEKNGPKDKKSEQKKSSESSSENRSHKSKTKSDTSNRKQIRKKKNEDTDTHIPVYYGK